jgi:ribonuclease HI
MDLWERSRRRPISWNWVMGHSGNPWNERCHSLVEEAVKRGA